jgi:hypothetical protein
MRTLSCLSILLPLALIAAAPICQAYGAKPANAEIMPLEDRDRARVDVAESKLKLKLLDLEDVGGGEDSSSSGSCGSVNIGNTNTNTNTNQTGTSLIAPHDTTVIVTGDVFNTATCGR